ncbi:MAG TPA: hypothetical protein VM324_10585 [Egibacteraceae bacterium]|nr:hypothetical protein [Egibacteraceae bacterium]
MMELRVSDEALALLRPLFAAVEGDCEAWTDEEVVRRIFIRGAMEYAKSAGREWEQVRATGAALRAALQEAGSSSPT